jgi:HD-GYP domain-containing protein (c-di-GMP phosphodiesterase class II)
MLDALSEAIEAHDPATRGHGVRVAVLAEAIAVRLGWDEVRLRALRLGGRLHDVGKLAISPRMLAKPGPLDERELRLVRAHPLAGAQLIWSSELTRSALPYVLYHHERWDGLGYPSGRVGPAIPVEGRVLAVADAFDAMTSTRPYRIALPVERALEELVRCAGTQFDPELAEVFVGAWHEGRLPMASEHVFGAAQMAMQ